MSDFIKNGNGYVVIKYINDVTITHTDQIHLNADIFAQGIQAFGGVHPKTKWYSTNNVTDVITNLVQRTHLVRSFPSVSIEIDTLSIFDTPNMVHIPLILGYLNGEYQYGPESTGVLFTGVQVTRQLFLDSVMVGSSVILNTVENPTSCIDDITYSDLLNVGQFNRVRYSVVATHSQGVIPYNSEGQLDDTFIIDSDYFVADSPFYSINNLTSYTTSDTRTEEPDNGSIVVDEYQRVFSNGLSGDLFSIVADPGDRRISFTVPINLHKTPIVSYNAYLSDSESYSSDCDYTDLFVTKHVTIDIDGVLTICDVYTYITEVSFMNGGKFNITLQPSD